MPPADDALSWLILLTPLALTILVVVAVLWVAHILLIRHNRHLGSDKLFSRQLIMLGLTLTGLLAIVFAMPVAESSRNQIVGLLGLLISGVFAFSSTNIFANLASGILLRVTRPFAIGDFISVSDHFGRVAARGLFDTEIQSENGELISVPNKYLIAEPVSALRSADAIVSSSLSLGYDNHHAMIEELLLSAAYKSGLNDPFVHITELGNYAVTYRVSGVLPEAKRFVTARSNLCKAVLDELHQHGVEIVSPTFMNQRQTGDEGRVIPKQVTVARRSHESLAEDILFDKAEQAERIVKEKQRLLDKIADLDARLKEVSHEQRQAIADEIARARKQLEEIEVLEHQGEKGQQGSGRSAD